jgi:hypothetical protein
MNVLRLSYDRNTGRLQARLDEGEQVNTIEARADDKVTLRIDRDRKLVTGFEIEDFGHFVNYHLLGDLFGDELIPAVARFQDAIWQSNRTRTAVQLSTNPRPSGRRLVEHLLRAA